MNNATPRLVKCVVWDLDRTLWDGVLLEDAAVALREHALGVVRILDSRGILQSVASRNDPGRALAALADFGLGEYFLFPQINWHRKSSSLEAIARALDLDLRAMAFVDDDPFERAEVSFAHPEVLCLDAEALDRLPAMAELSPPVVTAEASRRRLLYASEAARRAAEDAFVGPPEEFLATLGMRLRVAPAALEDLPRLEELMARAHRLNATGRTYRRRELEALQRSPEHRLLAASFTDRFGSYGTVGFVLIECPSRTWTIQLLLVSCRVLSRGVGTMLVRYVMGLAQRHGARLLAELVPGENNRMAHVTYRFAGFRERERRGPLVLLENTAAAAPPLPEYVALEEGAASR